MVSSLCEGRHEGRVTSDGGTACLERPDVCVLSQVRMIRAVRSALMIDDGEGSVEAWKLGWSELQWTETHDGEPQSIAPKWYQASPKIKYWRQGKFNRLGATHMAAKMMASQNIFVVFEATELMRVLLEGACEPSPCLEKRGRRALRPVAPRLRRQNRGPQELPDRCVDWRIRITDM